MTNVEFAIQYPKEVVREPLPSPKFTGIDWIGIPNKEKIVGQQVEINGDKWLLEVVGFQSSLETGEVQLHPEPTQQEDVYFLAGNGVMSRWDGLDCIRSVWNDTPLTGDLTLEQVPNAKYTLAVASHRLTGIEDEIEHMVLNVEIEGRTIPVEPVITPTGHYHATRLSEPSLYFVVKRKRI